MAFLQFVNGKALYECKVSPIGENLVELTFTKAVAPNTNGFNIWLKADKKVDIGGDSYHGFNTVYRTFSDDKTRFILSNDGSVWVPEVDFLAAGGTIEGQTEFKVNNYKDLVIPTPVDTENEKFVKWNPEIPAEGEITEDHVSFTAEFERHDYVEIDGVSYDVTSFGGTSFRIEKNVEECNALFENVTSYTADDVVYDNLTYSGATADDDTHSFVSFYQKSEFELRLERAESDIAGNREGLTETFESTLTNTEDISSLREGLEEVYEMISE